MARIWTRTAVLFMLFVLFLQVVVFLVLQHQYNRIKELRTQLQQELSPGVLPQISPTNYLPHKVVDNAGNNYEQPPRPFYSLAVTPGNLREHVAVTPGNVQEHLPRLFHSTAVPPNNANHLPVISCPKLLAGDTEEIKLVKQYRSGRESSTSNGFYLETTRDCPAFRRIRGYVESSVEVEEEAFPLAFSILLFRDVERTERLLRAIYRPWNHYCLHIDKKAGEEVYEVVSAIASCLPGVFLSRRRISVIREQLSVVTPELACMEDLWARRWRYFINLTGMEMPLRTNWELVQILKAYNGANDILGSVSWADRRRYRTVWRGATRTEIPKALPPHNITITKGSVHMAVTRGYVDYVLHNHVAKDFLHWCRNIHTPDEMYFSSLNHNPHLRVPGGFIGSTDEINKKKSYVRSKHWSYGNIHECPGEMVRHRVCLIGARSLHRLTKAPQLFANKFWENYEPVAYDCFEQWHRNRTQKQLLEGHSDLDLDFYRNLDFVRSHIPGL